MMVVIDKAGRVVIPKEIRDRFELTAGSELELVVLREGIRLERHRCATRALAWTDDGRPYFPAAEGKATTDSDVQDLRDAIQR
jgi:AbrB family looped-hinge helix DNA binding protein